MRGMVFFVLAIQIRHEGSGIKGTAEPRFRATHGLASLTRPFAAGRSSIPIAPQTAVPDKEYIVWFRMVERGIRRRAVLGEVPVRFDDRRVFPRRADGRGRPIRCNRKKRTGNALCPLLPVVSTTDGKAHCPVRGNMLKVLKRVRGRRKFRAVRQRLCRRTVPATEYVKRILKNGRNRNISRGG